MHVSEGILEAPVLVAGATASGAGVAYGLKKMSHERIPEVAVTTACFFVVSLVRVPLGPASLHLLFTGPLGLILGWASFPAILTALFLQAILLQVGGLTVLGVNTVNLALPAVLVWLLLRRPAVSSRNGLNYVAGVGAGAGAVAGSGLLLALELFSTGHEFWPVASGVLVAHLPVMVIEGLLAAACVVYLRKLRPAIFVT